MASGVKNVYIDPVTNELVVEYCGSRATDKYPIPCTCEDDGGGYPDAPGTQCQIANILADKTRALFYDLVQYQQEQPDNGAGRTIAAGQWIAAYSLPIGLLGPTVDFMAAHNVPYGGTINIGWDTYPAFNRAIVCAAYIALVNATTVNQTWRDYYSVLLDATTEPSDTNAAGWSAIAAFALLIPVEIWRQYAFDGVIGAYPEVEPCECEPDAGDCDAGSFGDVVYKWDDTEWASPSPDCYGAGVYEDCEPYNALRGQEFTLVYPTPRCIRAIKFNYAGNGACNSTTAEVYVNNVLQVTLTGLIGRTECFPGGGFISGSHLWAEPFANATSIKIKFINFTGSNPSLGLHLHCLTVNEGDMT